MAQVVTVAFLSVLSFMLSVIALVAILSVISLMFVVISFLLPLPLGHFTHVCNLPD